MTQEDKDEQDLRRHGFIMRRTPEKPMTRDQLKALKEWQLPLDEDDEPDIDSGFQISEK